jgi:hypothetical protein
MRAIPLLSAVAAALLWAAPGHGQVAPPNRDVPGAARTVNLTLEQRHVIRELVKELKVEPAKDEPKVAAGDNVPDKVELRPVPPLIGQKVPQIKSHRFFVTQRQIVIVDPQDPKVVEVIE